MTVAFPLRLHVPGLHRSSPRADHGSAVSTRKKPGNARFIFPVLAVGAIFQAIMQTVMVPLLPSLPEFTGAGPTAVSWLVTSTLLVGAVMTPIFGRLADMIGKKQMLLIAFGLMTVGSFICVLTSDIGILIFARCLQGAGAAVLPIGMAILRETMPRDKVDRSIAVLSSTLGIGTAVGIPFAAALVQFADWHMLFWVTTAIGVGVTAGAALVVPPSTTRTGGRFDTVGAAGLSGALICLLVPITQGSTWGWTSPAVIGMFVAAVLLFLIWGAQQLRNRNPLVDLRVSARRSVLAPHVSALLVGFAFYGNTLITTQLLQASSAEGAGYDLTILQAAVCQLPASFAMMIFAIVAARVSERFGPKIAVMTGAVFLIAGYSIHAVPGKPLWTVVLAIFVAAIGTTFVYCTLPILLLGAVPLDQNAAANGVNVLLRTVGSTVCSAVVASVLAAHTLAGGIGTAGFVTVYLVCGLCAVIVFFFAFALPSRVAKRVETTDRPAHASA